MEIEEILNQYDTYKITDILVQKNDTSRFSVFINNHFALGISNETYDHFHLKKGLLLDKSTIDSLLLFEKKYKANSIALAYIARQARTEFEVRQKLKQSQVSSEIIDQVIQEFKHKKYIDDQDFAAMMARDFLKFKSDGIYKLVKKLIQKGVQKDIIDNVVEEYVSEEDQFEKALNLAIKKSKFLGKKKRTKEKVYRFLVQKGFETSIILKVLDEIFNG